jgi:hypothetical protein
MATTQDCTLCFNCLRACPYDNVALELRSPAREAADARPRTDWALFLAVLAWGGLVNAFAMVPPFYALAASLSGALGTRSEALVLGLIQGAGLGGGLLLTLGAARASGGRLRDWAPVLGPLALAAWGGHYLYHFVTGYSTLLPNLVVALERLGLPLGPPPVATVPARDAAFTWQVGFAYLALSASLWGAYRRAGRSGAGLRALWPQVLLALVFVALMILVFAQPMEARGSLLGT